jgi:DNA-binding NtrC family response regulator
MNDSNHGGSLRILFADDESHLRELMQMELPRLGHDVTVCPDGVAALKALEKGSFDVALMDMRMPGLTGIEVLGKIRSICPETAVIILTGHATVDTAVQALRLGAFDYLTKPCKWAELESILKRVAERRDLSHKAVALETRLKQAEGTPLLVGEGAAMSAVRNLIDTIAPTDASVLVLGETGTGKELVARNLHDRSRRASGAFVPVNCGALPENLVESELFGHRKGAFTGAETSRKGLFEVANGGTLFLDEIGELNKSVQVKLLRFLESGEIRRVGENDPFRVDVRVLCATHRDLREMIQEDLFREDLYFRLNTFEIHLPALRERSEDIPVLAGHMLKRFHRSHGPLPELTPEAISALMEHHWSGNVRELANAMERAVILSAGRPIQPEHLPNFSGRKVQVSNLMPVQSAASQILQSGAKTLISHSGHLPAGSNLTLRDVEMQFIQSVLEKHNGNKPAAAKELGISLKTLYNKINQLQQTGPLED